MDAASHFSRACPSLTRRCVAWRAAKGRGEGDEPSKDIAYASVMSYRLAQIFLRAAFPGGHQLPSSSVKVNARPSS